MRKKLDGYWEILKGNLSSNKIPKTHTTTTPSKLDRRMEDLIKNGGRKFKQSMDYYDNIEGG